MANNTLIGALRAEATLESGKFVDGAKKIRTESKKTEVQLKKDFGSMGSSVKGFGTALTAGLSIGLLGGIIKKSLDFATSIKDVAKQAGVTTKALQEYRYAASQVGIAQEVADKGLERLNLTIGKAAAGSVTAQKALAAVGVTMEDVKKKSTTQIFGQIADQMIKQGGAAKNAAAANAVFGESAAKLNPLLDKGSRGMNELAESAHRLGVVLSDQQIQQADETARKLDDVRRVLAAQIAGVVADNAQAIVGLAGALGQLTGEIVKFLNSNPAVALAIIGGLLGGRVGGLPGAAAGAVGGFSIGLANFDGTKGLAPEQGLLRHNFLKEAKTLREMRAGRTGQLDPATQAQAAKVKRLRDKFIAAGGTIPGFNDGGPAAGTVPQFLAPDPKKGRTSRTRRGPRDRSDDVTFQFDQELRRAQMDVLRAQQGMARTSEERASIALQLLDAEREMQEAELNNRVRRAERDFAEGKITAGALKQAKLQAEKLRAEYDSVDALQRQAIADDLAADKARDAQELSDSAYDLRLEQLQLESALAETAGERREAELRILDLMKQQEKARLDAVIADQQSSELAREEARQRLANIDKIYAGRAKVVEQGTMGPLESYFDSLPGTTEKWNEALENVAANGLKAVEDGLVDILTGAESVGDALRNIVKSLLEAWIRLQVQSLIATVGGGFQEGGFTGFASGGFTGGAGRSRIAGVVHGQEFVLNADATKRIGISNLDAMNKGIPLPRTSFGERVSVSNDNDGGYMSNGPLIGNITLPPGMTQREGRATGLAIGRGIQERLGYTVTGRKR